MRETLILVGSCASAMIAIITCITLIVKSIKDSGNKWIKETSNTDELDKKMEEIIDLINTHFAEDKRFKERMIEDIESLKDGTGMLLGDVIKNIYNEHKKEKIISEKEMSRVNHCYAIYHDTCHQNGVIESLYLNMKTWDVVVDDSYLL